ncbi:MAG: AAA family ATPase [Desulfobacterales bacterium]|nr:AAA family ATPase [Desulfobacterales bacterium]
MKKICLVNQKGGCGKTTTAINLASCLAGEGKNVLLIDMDPQGHSALGLGVKPEHIDDSIYEVLSGKIPINKAIQTLRENLEAVFSNVVLSAFEQVMAGAPGREFKLTGCLADIENDYDYLIIDSPPSVGLLTFNGLMASDEVMIPVDPSFFSLHGLGKLLHTIRIIEEKIRHQLSIKILASNIDRRTNFGRDMVETLKARFPENCFRTIVHTCTRLREAASHGKPISEYDKHCVAFRDYQNLTEEILDEEAKMKSEFFGIRAPVEVEERQKEPMKKEIAFTFEAPADAAVQVAGDFNDWVPESLQLTESQGRPLWQKAISLKPGSYQYKYLIDDRWLPDPANDKTVDDLFGGANSIISV